MALNRDVKVTLVGEDRASRTFDKVGKSSGGLAGKLSSVGKSLPIVGAAVAGVAVGAIKLGSAFIDTSSRLEALEAKSKTVFGDQIGRVQKWAKANASAMKLTSSEAVGLATNMADLLIPMKFTRAQATDMATKTIGLAGALSKWSGGTYTASAAADILTSAMLGETDALKGLGISISAAEIDARLLAQGQDKLTGSARAQAEALATQALIFEKSTDAQAGFAAGGQTLASRMEGLKVKFREAWEQLVVKLTPAAERFADWVGTTGSTQLQKFVGWVQANRDGFIDFAAATVRSAADVMRALGTMVQTASIGFASMLTASAMFVGVFDKDMARSMRKAATEISVFGVTAKRKLDDAATSAEGLAARIERIKNKTINVTVNYQEVGKNPSPRAADRARPRPSASRTVPSRNRSQSLQLNNVVQLDGRTVAESTRSILVGDRVNGRVLGLS